MIGQVNYGVQVNTIKNVHNNNKQSLSSNENSRLLNTQHYNL